MSITVGSQNFDDTITDLYDRYIKCTTTEVVYHDPLLAFIIKSVCQCCGCRLVNDTLYFEACDLAGVLGCLTLSIIEVCGYGYDRFGNFLTQIILCICFQLLQDHCRNLLR